MIVFSWRGVRVEIRFLFVAVITLCLLLDQTQAAFYGLLASLMHETGHLIAFAMTGCRPRKIAFEMTGIALTKSTVNLSYRKELVVLVAGSAVNLIIFGIAVLIAGDIDRVDMFAAAHLVVGVMNLLPIAALDGGKIMSLLLMQSCSEQRANAICFGVQLIFIAFIMNYSIGTILQGELNFTLLILLFYLIAMLLMG